MAITKQDVWRVANEIDAAGSKPTAVEARKRLGSGSYTTITAALKEWTQPDGDDKGAELEPVPAEFEEKMIQAGADLFALAMKIAGEQFQAERDAWTVERAGIEAERDEAIRIGDLNSAEIDDMRKENERMNSERDQAQEEARTAKTRAIEIERRAEELRAEVTRVTDLMHEQRTEIMQTQKENAMLMEERGKAFAIADENRRAAQKARDEAQEAQERTAMLRGRVEALENVITKLQPAATSKTKRPATKNGDASKDQVAGSVANGKGVS